MTILIIYIPLCIYFNSFFKTCPYVLAIFTFHYVSISTIVFILLENHLVYLHSTMYLFQLILFLILSLVGTNLHSTMYLFQPLLDTLSSPFCIIYIPLCIYFNLYLLPFLLCPTHIYIPLCIYFNNKQVRYVPVILIFTFHYVSISTRLPLMILSSVTIIYIPLCIYFNNNVIMWLFRFARIYIPLCIYFNQLYPLFF